MQGETALFPERNWKIYCGTTKCPSRTQKPLYADLAALESICGLQLEYDQHKKGYWLLNPPFEPYELHLLVDSVQSSKFITREKASMGCVMSKCFEMLCKWSL